MKRSILRHLFSGNAAFVRCAAKLVEHSPCVSRVVVHGMFSFVQNLGRAFPCSKG